jgi:hypothetical protein
MTKEATLYVRDQIAPDIKDWKSRIKAREVTLEDLYVKVEGTTHQGQLDFQDASAILLCASRSRNPNHFNKLTDGYIQERYQEPDPQDQPENDQNNL